MKIQNINSTNFEARLRFNNQHPTPPTMLRYHSGGMVNRCVQSFFCAGKYGLALTSVSKIIKRIKQVKNSVKFPD